ncbi:MAG: hypothetical protein R2854_16135 [Caldilineaceae bacterium]
MGLFAVGASPTGSADPSACAAALGVVNNSAGHGDGPDLDQAVDRCRRAQPVAVTAEARSTPSISSRRLQGVLLDEGYCHDIVDAVLGVRGNNPYAARRAADALTAGGPAVVGRRLTAYARCARITRVAEEYVGCGRMSCRWSRRCTMRT